jgi:hypothetical protein
MEIPSGQCLHCYAGKILKRVDALLALEPTTMRPITDEAKDYAIRSARAALEWLAEPREHDHVPCPVHTRASARVEACDADQSQRA